MKMNQTRHEFETYVHALIKAWKTLNFTQSLHCVLMPSFVHFGIAQNILVGQSIVLGAQNVGENEAGAFTGEISALQLHSYGCYWVLIGHAERRSLETMYGIQKKMELALKSGIKVVLCVGESQKIDSDNMDCIVEQQLDVLDGFERWKEKIVIAYEPVWAIGTGKTPNIHDIVSSVEGISRYAQTKFGLQLPIVYGGSVSPKNIKMLCSISGISGLLIGSAALDCEKVLQIMRFVALNNVGTN